MSGSYLTENSHVKPRVDFQSNIQWLLQLAFHNLNVLSKKSDILLSVPLVVSVAFFPPKCNKEVNLTQNSASEKLMSDVSPPALYIYAALATHSIQREQHFKELC